MAQVADMSRAMRRDLMVITSDLDAQLSNAISTPPHIHIDMGYRYRGVNNDVFRPKNFFGGILKTNELRRLRSQVFERTGT
jgi:hypothetical protein